MLEESQPSPGVDRRVRLAQLLMAVAICGFAVSTIPGVRARTGFDVVLDGWVQGSAYVLTAVVAVLRPLTSAVERTLWTLVAAALSMRALAFVAYLVVVRNLEPVPYPSVSDIGWLTASVILFMGLAHLAGRTAKRLSRTLVLDSIIGGLTVAAVATTFFYDTLLRLTGSGIPTEVVVTNLLYPLSDVALLVLVVGVLTAAEWRPSASTATISAGVVGFAIVDCVFLYQVSTGTYRAGTALASVSLIATSAIAMSGWLPETRNRSGRAEQPPGLALPALFSLVCIGLLAYAAFETVPLVSMLLVAASLITVVARAALTIVQDRSEAARSLRAKHEELVRFQALVETSGDFIAIALLDGSVIYVNPAGRRLVGLPPEADVTRTTIVDYLTEEGQRASLELEQPAVIAHGRWEGESTLRDLRGGPPIPVAISSFLMLHPDTREPFALATVQRDITERRDAERALHRLAEQRQTLLNRLVQAQEDERARIAEDVHDDSVQALAAVELRLGLLRRELDRAAPELIDRVDVLSDTISEATGRLRHLLFDLESPALETDLWGALRQAAGYVFEDGEVEWTMTGDPRVVLPKAPRVTAYRIAKEAMVNVRKHARARLVTIDVREHDGGVMVTVSDDGVGMESSSTGLRDRPGHHGLANMSDRAEVAGGQLLLQGRPGLGTQVRLWLPTD